MRKDVNMSPGIKCTRIQGSQKPLLWEKLALFRLEFLLDNFHNVQLLDNMLMDENKA